MKNTTLELIDEFNILMLRKRFYVLCDGIYALTGINVNTDKEFTWIKHNYTSSLRKYHDINHITTSLNLYDTIRNKISDGKRRLALQFAIIYHDIIYIPGVDEFNIKNSISSAEDALNNTMFVNDFSMFVKYYIKATDHEYFIDRQDLRNKMDINSKYMSDIDLYNLSLPWSEFTKNNIKIRDEYIHMSDEDFYIGQKKLFENILSLDNIYLTSTFCANEKQARNNIERQIILSQNNNK